MPQINRPKSTRKLGQLVGNVGLYLVCYELSKRGWNVLPTSRNARGIDIVGYDQSGKRTKTFQVKALSRSYPVPLGSGPNSLIADFLIIVTKVFDTPEFFIAEMPAIKPLIHVGEKNGKKSYWLQPAAYAEFRNCWDKIGCGFVDSFSVDNTRL